MIKSNKNQLFFALFFLSSSCTSVISTGYSYGQPSYGQAMVPERPSYGQASYSYGQQIAPQVQQAELLAEKQDDQLEKIDAQEEAVLVVEAKKPVKKALSEAQLKKLKERREQRKIATKKRKEAARNKEIASKPETQVVAAPALPAKNVIPAAPALPVVAQSERKAAPEVVPVLPALPQAPVSAHLAAIQAGMQLKKPKVVEANTSSKNDINALLKERLQRNRAVIDDSQDA